MNDFIKIQYVDKEPNNLNAFVAYFRRNENLKLLSRNNLMTEIL